MKGRLRWTHSLLCPSPFFWGFTLGISQFGEQDTFLSSREKTPSTVKSLGPPVWGRDSCLGMCFKGDAH